MVDWEKGGVFKTLPKETLASPRFFKAYDFIRTYPLFDIGLIIFTFDQRIRNSEDKAFAKLVNYSEKFYENRFFSSSVSSSFT